MIVLVVIREEDERGRFRSVVSHGYDVETDHPVVLPPVPPVEVGARFSEDLGEWVID